MNGWTRCIIQARDTTSPLHIDDISLSAAPIPLLQEAGQAKRGGSTVPLGTCSIHDYRPSDPVTAANRRLLRNRTGPGVPSTPSIPCDLSLQSHKDRWFPGLYSAARDFLAFFLLFGFQLCKVPGTIPRGSRCCAQLIKTNRPPNNFVLHHRRSPTTVSSSTSASLSLFWFGALRWSAAFTKRSLPAQHGSASSGLVPGPSARHLRPRKLFTVLSVRHALVTPRSATHHLLSHRKYSLQRLHGAACWTQLDPTRPSTLAGSNCHLEPETDPGAHFDPPL